jgi:hypothetical protein
MEKQQYINLLSDAPWDRIDEYYGDKDRVPASYITKIDIDSDAWTQYTVDRFDLAQQKWEYPKEHYSAEENKIADINNQVGRNEHNSFELNYGVNGNTNQELVAMLGEENIERMGIEPEGILIRLIVNMPGHGVAWHHDAASSYFTKIYPDYTGTLDDLTRLWFSVVPWYNGHVFQIGSSMLHNWSAGDVWHIPWGVPHGSINFGYNIKYTVSLTGRKIR